MYVLAVKQMKERERRESKKQDYMANAAKITRDEEATTKMLRAMTFARKGADGRVEDDWQESFDMHLDVRRHRKGDGATRPRDGDLVAVTFTGLLAEGTQYCGEEWGGKLFDSSAMRKDPKTGSLLVAPLTFRMGDRKANVRGLEACVRTMTLGEQVTLTVAPPWGYKKGGRQDTEGAYVVPPNATLVFDQLKLVRVNNAWKKDDDKEPKSPSRSPKAGPTTPPRSPRGWAGLPPSPYSAGCISPGSPGSPITSPGLHPTGNGWASPSSPSSPLSNSSWPKAPPKMRL